MGTPSYLASAVDGVTAMLGVTNYIPNQVSLFTSSSVVYIKTCIPDNGYTLTNNYQMVLSVGPFINHVNKL